MTRKASGAEDTAATLLRLAVGIIFIAHGWGKVVDVAGTAQHFASLGIPEPHIMVYVAIAGEFVGGLGLLLGFLTRIAALGTLCTMLVAIMSVHLGHGLFAKNGGWEYPLVLALVSLFFVTHGARVFSIDALLARADTPGFRGERVTSHA
jgi:putative oxidoreductase